MGKTTDSTSSTSSSSSNRANSAETSTVGSGSNTPKPNSSNCHKRQQIQQNSPIIKNTQTKNEVNSIGCGPSSTSLSSATTVSSYSTNSLLLEKGAAACGDVGNNLKSNTNNNKLSFNNSSTTTTTTNITTLLGHQSSSKSNSNNTNTISNNAGCSTAAVGASNLSASGSSVLTPTSTSSTSTSSSQIAPISLNISTTTGGNFSVSVDPQITVENLKKIIAKKLKVVKDRIRLLHREKELQDGLLKENNLMDGSRIILLPNVETGLLAQRPENTVMQALEALNDTQVNDFLSGKTPLNLSMRLGDHMMLIQLQLSTINPINCPGHSCRELRQRHHHHIHRSCRSICTNQTSVGNNSQHYSHHQHHHHHGTALVSNGLATSSTSSGQQQQKMVSDTTAQTPSNISTSKTTVVNATNLSSSSSSTVMPATSIVTTSASGSLSTESTNQNLNSVVSKRNFESLQNIVRSTSMPQPSSSAHLQQQPPKITTAQMASSSKTNKNTTVVTPTFHNSTEAALLEQSPIKSLSNLVSTPIKTTAIKNIPNISNNNTNNNNSNNNSSSKIANNAASIETHANSKSAICQDPISAKLTSCLCTRLNGGGLNTINNMSHAPARQCIDTTCISTQQQQLVMQPHTTRTSTSTVMTSNSSSTPNCNAALTPAAMVNSVNGSTICSSPTAPRSSTSLHKIAYNPITRKHKHHNQQHPYQHSAAAIQQLNNMAAANQKINTTSPTKIVSNDGSFCSAENAATLNNSSAKSALTSTATATTTTVVGTPLNTSSSKSITSTVRNTTTTASTPVSPIDSDESSIASDALTLAEASRNLTQTLRKLSKEVFTNKIDFSTSEETPRKSVGPGAVIESMKNHGKGIYSGTFSGTLNPALQDRYGRPKRDISTVIHILNDLLSATPHYHRGARLNLEAPSTSAAAAASVAAASGSTGTIHHNSRTKFVPSSKHHQPSQPCFKCIKSHNCCLSPTVNLPCATNANAAGTSSPSSSTSSCNLCSSKSHLNKIYTCCQQQNIASTSQNCSTSSVNNASTSNHHQNHASSSVASHHASQQTTKTDERRDCQCRYRIHTQTGERERDYTCPKCATELDNLKTKCKLDQIRLVMQQSKQKREARKLKGAPYGARVVGTTTTATASGVADSAATTLTTSNSSITTPISVATTSSTTPTSEVSPNHLVEEVDTAA